MNRFRLDKCLKINHFLTFNKVFGKATKEWEPLLACSQYGSCQANTSSAAGTPKQQTAGKLVPATAVDSALPEDGLKVVVPCRKQSSRTVPHLIKHGGRRLTGRGAEVGQQRTTGPTNLFLRRQIALG